MRIIPKLSFLICLGLITSVISLAQGPPRNLQGEFHEGAIQLSWNHPEGEANPNSYNVYRRVNDETLWHKLAPVTGTEFFDTFITPNTLYHYKVTAMFGEVESDPSNIVEVHTPADNPFPPPPRELEGEFHDQIVSLHWHHPESHDNPSFYKVYRGSETVHPPVVIATTPDTAYNDSTVVLRTMYGYVVTAVYNDTMESMPSNLIQVFTGEDTVHDSTHVAIHFTTEPRHFALVNQLYQYDADVATMPPGVSVCFRLEHGPDGMTIDAVTGLVEWTPSVPGIFEIEIKAQPCDGREGEAEQEFHLFVLSGSPGSVSGMVRNTGGEGIRNVKIKLFDVAHGEFVMRTRTDSSGYYSFPFVNPTTYFVRAKPENEVYAPQWFDGATHIEDATPVVVHDSESVTANFTLLPRDTVEDRFTLSGTVMDTGSTPIGEARVMVFRVEHDSLSDDMFDDHHDECDHDPVRVTHTDSNGHYQFVLHRGTYIVGAMAEGFLPQFWDHKHSPLEANRIPLTENTSGIDFNLEPRLQGTGSITGVVRNAQDSTALESHVLGFMKDTTGHFTGFVAFARTDSTGAYTLEHLPNGSFIVLAKAEHDFVPTFYNTSGGTPFLDSATAVDVSGSAVTGIDIYVQPDSAEGLNSIAGQIQSSSSQMERIPTLATPVAGALVAIKNSSNQVVGTAVSLEDGSYLAPGLAPGTYTVVFQKPGKTTASTPVSVTYVNNTPTMTTVNAQLSDASGSGPLGTMNVHASWNLVSLPVTVTDASKSSVFPMAISAAFRYVPGSGYQTSSILDYGAGYWVKFPAAQAFSISGTARTNQSITVSADWNLIGSLSSSIATTAITSTPPGIIASKFFGYNGGYTLASSLEPGKGYWVKSSSAGTLTMNTGASTPKSGGSIIADLEGLNSLTIKDRSGNSQTLYFGSNTNSINRTLYQLPPSPPADAFDVRFASHQLIEMHPSSMKTMMEFPITVQSAREPLTIRWIINDNTAGYKITDANGKSFTPSYMTGKGSLQLNASGVTRLSLQAQPKELPKEFALHQNFPNPFNPSTNISFDLPKASIVTLRVYNILGQEVTTLLNAITLDAGAHAISFDASALGTGVYFYKLQANEFVSVKKMMLIR